MWAGGMEREKEIERRERGREGGREERKKKEKKKERTKERKKERKKESPFYLWYEDHLHFTDGNLRLREGRSNSPRILSRL